MLHSTKAAVVADLPHNRRIRPEHAIVTLDWKDSFPAAEVLEFNEAAVVGELCRFAKKARELRDLDEPIPMSLRRSLQKRIFYARLRMGHQ